MKSLFQCTVLILVAGCASSQPKPARDVIDEAIKNRKISFLNCHQNQSEMNMQFQWIINLKGQAEQIKLIKSNYSDPEMEKCMIKIIADIHFPQPTSRMTIKYPFKFSK